MGKTTRHIPAGEVARIHHIATKGHEIKKAVTQLDRHPIDYAGGGSVASAFGSKRAPAPWGSN